MPWCRKVKPGADNALCFPLNTEIVAKLSRAATNCAKSLAGSGFISSDYLPVCFRSLGAVLQSYHRLRIVANYHELYYPDLEPGQSVGGPSFAYVLGGGIIFAVSDASNIPRRDDFAAEGVSAVERRFPLQQVSLRGILLASLTEKNNAYVQQVCKGGYT
ncbi:hypothetical protein Bbelb_182080 [Branchiostoma belcheri]|nr:hypothetical protein Bbelb_182080 [Branchiostoma belcheri]